MTTESKNIYHAKPLGIGKDGIAYRAIIVDDTKLSRQILKQILLSIEFVIIEEIDNGDAALKYLTVS